MWLDKGYNNAGFHLLLWRSIPQLKYVCFNITPEIITASISLGIFFRNIYDEIKKNKYFYRKFAKCLSNFQNTSVARLDEKYNDIAGILNETQFNPNVKIHVCTTMT